MRIAMNPAVDENRQKQRTNHDPECSDEQGGKNGKYAHRQNDSPRNLQHRSPQSAIVALFAPYLEILIRIFATFVPMIPKGAHYAL